MDALVLVAATGAGLAFGQAQGGPRLDPFTIDDIADTDEIANFAVGLLLMWAVAVLALNLTRYRATLSEMARRPGFSAVVAITIDWVSEVTIAAFSLLAGILPPLPGSSGLLPPVVWDAVRLAHYESPSARTVTAVWLVLAMAGCWRAEKTWIDRIGRVLGIFWIILAVAFFFMLGEF